MTDHPDTDRWWERKWRFALVGGIFSILSIAVGILIVILGGPEYADAIRPLSIAGMWGGLAPLGAFMTEAGFENIAQSRKH